MAPRGLISGSGRCGTKSVARFLDGCVTAQGTVSAAHESEADRIVAALLDGSARSAEKCLCALQSTVEVSPYLIFFPERPLRRASLVAIVRDGRGVIVSGINTGWYLPQQSGGARWMALMPEFPGSRFERCCFFWVWANERLDEFGASFFRLEDLVSHESARVELVRAAVGETPTSLPEFPHRNSATSTKKLVESEGVPAIGTWESWDAEELRAFEMICGVTMDRYYAGWRGKVARV